MERDGAHGRIEFDPTEVSAVERVGIKPEALVRLARGTGVRTEFQRKWRVRRGAAPDQANQPDQPEQPRQQAPPHRGSIARLPFGARLYENELWACVGSRA